MRYTAALPFFALALGLVAVLPAHYGTVLARSLSRVAPLLIGALFAGFLVRAVMVARSPPVVKLDAASAPCKVADPQAHHKHMAEVHQARSARSPLQQALDSPFMQAGVLLLIFSDVATTLCELMLSEVCPAPPHGSRAAHHLEHWEGRLAWTGRAMLGVLMLHQLSLLYAYGAEFWHHKMHVLDFVICCVAVALEAFELLKGEGAQHSGEGDKKDEAFLMIMLAWRVVRVLHGFFVHAYEHVEMSHHKGELHLSMAKLHDEHEKIHGLHREHMGLLLELKGLAEQDAIGAIKARLVEAYKHEEEEDEEERKAEEAEALAEQKKHGHHHHHHHHHQDSGRGDHSENGSLRHRKERDTRQ